MHSISTVIITGNTTHYLNTVQGGACVTTLANNSWWVCSREPACHSLSQCNNETASVDRVVCFVEVYSELICLRSVKFCLYETSLRAFDVKGNSQGSVDQIIIYKKAWSNYGSNSERSIQCHSSSICKEHVHTVVHIPGAIIPCIMYNRTRYTPGKVVGCSVQQARGTVVVMVRQRTHVGYLACLLVVTSRQHETTRWRARAAIHVVDKHVLHDAQTSCTNLILAWEAMHSHHIRNHSRSNQTTNDRRFSLG